MRSKDLIKAIILAGSHDFGRCALASRLPTALWPVMGKSVLEHLLTSLANQGIKQATICSTCAGSLLEESIHADNRLDGRQNNCKSWLSAIDVSEKCPLSIWALLLCY